MTNSDRITALERELAELRGQLAVLTQSLVYAIANQPQPQVIQVGDPMPTWHPIQPWESPFTYGPMIPAPTNICSSGDFRV